jgi:hypothetical protein
MPVLSVPSWVIPGTYAENLRFLENKREIRGVELLFFLYDDAVRKQLKTEWEEIRGYRERFIFTAHLPELLLPEHEDLIKSLAPLARHFIVHPDAENPEGQAALLERWAERYGAVFLTENIAHGTAHNADLPLLDKESWLCMDTGHLLLDGESPACFFRAGNSIGKERIKEIHLHSLERERAAIDGRLQLPEKERADHRRLREDEPWLLELLPLLKDYEGIVNLEVFSWEEAEAGIEVLKKLQMLD